MARAESWSPLDDRWYAPMGALVGSVAGVVLSQEAALRVSTVWSCATLISEAIGSLPLITYRQLPDGGKQRATNHPLYDVLHDAPNAVQTSPEFVSLLTMWALLRGNGYARIRPGPRGPVDTLEVLSPDVCRPELTQDGALRYRVRTGPTGGQWEVVNAEDIFHLRGPSLDGWMGLSVIAHARTSMGLALAAEEYGARFFGQGARPGGILSTDQKLRDDVVARTQEQWHGLFGGLENAHKTAVLEQGLKYQQISIAPEDAQFIATREFSVEDVARWFRVPLPLIGHTAKGQTGTGIEMLGLQFLTYCILPWLKRWEAAIRTKLILAPQVYFAEFLVDALLRGDTASRTAAYGSARQWGWLNVNEIRDLEGRNPVEGGDVYLQPVNMAPAGTVPDQQPAVLPGEGGLDGTARLRWFVHDAAGRVLRRESAALGRLARRCAAVGAESGDPWAAGVGEFYGEHAEFVRQALRLPADAAATWCAEQRAELVAKGAPLLTDEWEIARAADLAALALEGG
jgi:HK97 family phage portal protein